MIEMSNVVVRFGPCAHRWIYSTTTGGLSCLLCMDARTHDDPLAVQYRTAIADATNFASRTQAGDGGSAV